MKPWTVFPVLLLAASLAQAGDAKQGQTLYQANCGGCHDTSIHTRPNSIIHSLDSLKKRVQFCETGNRLHWSAAQVEDVATYLNESFYKFGKTP